MSDDLPDLCTSENVRRRARLAADANTPAHLLAELAASHPAAVARNPAFELALVADPGHLRRYSATALRGLFKCRFTPALALEAAIFDLEALVDRCGDLPDFVATHPAATPFVIDRLDLAGNRLSGFHLRSRHAFARPWVEAAREAVRFEDRHRRFPCLPGLTRRMGELGMYPTGCAFCDMLREVAARHGTGSAPAWRPETCALLAQELRQEDPVRLLFNTGCLQDPASVRQSRAGAPMLARIALAINPSTDELTVRDLAEQDHQWPVVAAAREALERRDADGLGEARTTGARLVPRPVFARPLPIAARLALGRVRSVLGRSGYRPKDVEECIASALREHGACRVLLAGGEYEDGRFRIVPEGFLGQALGARRHPSQATEQARGLVSRFIAEHLAYALPLLG